HRRCRRTANAARRTGHDSNLARKIEGFAYPFHLSSPPDARFAAQPGNAEEVLWAHAFERLGLATVGKEIEQMLVDDVSTERFLDEDRPVRKLARFRRHQTRRHKNGYRRPASGDLSCEI